MDSKDESIRDSKEAYYLPRPTPHTLPRSRSFERRHSRIRLLISILSILSLWSLYYYSHTRYIHLEPFSSSSSSSLKGYLTRFGGDQYHKWGNIGHHSRPRLTEQELIDEFLTIPSTESARKISKSFTRETHIAGTKGDKKSALRVKSLWEELLGLKQTSSNESIYDAGTLEDKRALIGHDGDGDGDGNCETTRGRRQQGGKQVLSRIQKSFYRFFNFFDYYPSSHHHHHHHHRHHHHHHHHHHHERVPTSPRVWISTYYPYLNYPISNSLSLFPTNSSVPIFKASLTEESFPLQDPTSQFGVPTFHGFSKNGTARGNLVYASRGTLADYARLEKEGISVEGKVVLVQYGGNFRGLKVKLAQEKGAVGVLIYSDPISDGEVTKENGYEVYPFGPARAPSSVQRGSVQYLSIRPGDPLTPFKPAYNPNLPESPDRLPMNDSSLVNIPSIPSLPISYEDAIPLLKSLNGHGIKRQDTLEWKEGGLGYLGVEYFTGPSTETFVEFVNEMDDRKTTPIWNTMAFIPGLIKDEIVVIGNHNDAWTFGAGDPNSGTTSMYETIKGLAHLYRGDKKNWKPLRSLLLCSWDAEEYGLIGSTEFGEDFTEYLREKVVAYLNLDVSVSGSEFELASSPSLADLLKQSTEKVFNHSSHSNSSSSLMIEKKKEKDISVKTLGSGSDFSVFLQYIGLASGNLGFSTSLKNKDPVYHYHSNFDSYSWMENFGDPTFERHVFVSKVLGLTALSLLDSLVLPLNITAYALELEKYLVKVVDSESYPGKDALDLTNLGSKLSNLVLVSKKLDQRASKLAEQLDQLSLSSSSSNSIPSSYKDNKKQKKERRHLLREIQKINEKKKTFESTLLVPPGEPGLKGREWYKSLVVAPGRWLGYGATTLPGLTEALELDHDLVQAKKEVERLEQSIDRATKLLES